MQSLDSESVLEWTILGKTSSKTEYEKVDANIDDYKYLYFIEVSKDNGENMYCMFNPAIISVAQFKNTYKSSVNCFGIYAAWSSEDYGGTAYYDSGLYIQYMGENSRNREFWVYGLK